MTHKEQEDMKTYVLTLSQKFPAMHSKTGQPTFFKDKMHAAIIHNDEYWNKLHTIRANYPLWRERFNQIARGEACLSVRQWTGKPYCSKQVEIARLTAEDGIGLEILRIDKDGRLSAQQDPYGWYTHVSASRVAQNDGLSLEDWCEWFANPAYDKTQPLAIIHFTKFRYCTNDKRPRGVGSPLGHDIKRHKTTTHTILTLTRRKRKTKK